MVIHSVGKWAGASSSLASGLKDSHVSCQLEGKGGVILQRDLCICELEADLSIACWSYITIFVPATVGTPRESACEQR
jgi:hypothetical protein